MSHDRRIESQRSDVTTMKFDGTELTLALPGEGRSSPAVTAAGGKNNINVSKRGFMETVDLKFNGPFEHISKPRGSNGTHVNDTSEGQVVGTGKSPPSKAQVIGWPPVRSYRKKALHERRSKLVKVAVDGAAYLRKVDLTTYGSYEHLLGALQEMFSSTFTIRGNNCKKNQLRMKGTEYVATYEDKDDDWMLVGDVPWKMFVESCKRIRLMKTSEAMGLGPGTSADCASSS